MLQNKMFDRSQIVSVSEASFHLAATHIYQSWQTLRYFYKKCH